MNVLWVAVGGAIGASARHGVNLACARILGAGFPWSTLIVNVVGCLAMGIIAGLMQQRLQLSDAARLFLTTGILGGFTTFSAFGLDVANLTGKGANGAAFAYVLASVLLSLAAVYAGMTLARTYA
jgi:fluoride exporter